MKLEILDATILLLLFPALVSVSSSVAGSPKNIDEILSVFSIVPINSIRQRLRLKVNDSDPYDFADGCRDASLHKCGSNMVRVFRLLDYLPLHKSYAAKCGLRQAFFDCLRIEDSPCKKRHWRSNDSQFRKKLLKSLWSTRGCILGSLPNGTHI